MKSSINVGVAFLQSTEIKNTDNFSKKWRKNKGYFECKDFNMHWIAKQWEYSETFKTDNKMFSLNSLDGRKVMDWPQ